MGRKQTVYQKYIQEKAFLQMDDSLQNERGKKAQHLDLHQMLFQGKDGYQETTNSHAKSAMRGGKKKPQ